jgi:glycosyltransferase involved in cell wall biosynthesis
MNILQVISSVNPAGGGPIEAVRQLQGPLQANGHQIEIVSLDSPVAPFLKESTVLVHPLGPARLGYAFSSRLIPWLRTNRSRYDVVIVNGIWQFHSFAVWRALRNSDTPYVVFTHGMLDPWFKHQYPLKHVKKWMYWPWAEYRVLRDAHAVLFTCEEERLLARKSFRLYRCKEAVVTCGIAKPKENPGSQLQEFLMQYPHLRDRRVALYMGRIHPKKGCDLLIEAFATVLGEHPEWSLVIAGPDQVGWREQLNCRAERLRIASRITWTGMLSGSLKWGAFRAAEIFVLPSHQENFGIAIVEALAASVPTLISNKVNIWREIERDGGGVIAADDLQGSCELLRSYLMMSEGQKFSMRQRAYRCFEQRFEIGKVAERLQSTLQSVTATA